MKFKVGDKVKVINVGDNHKWIKHLEGTVGVIKNVFKCANPDVGCYDIGLDYIISENELELVEKAKFKIGDTVKVIGTNFDFKKEYIGIIRKIVGIHPALNDGRGPRYAVEDEHFIFYGNELELVKEKKDMKKEFTKADLKNGDVVKFSDNIIGIVCLETDTIIQKKGFDEISDLTDDLKFKHSSCGAQIMAVRRPLSAHHCVFNAFEKKFGELVYERKEVEEMTLEEVCKALGKEIKIIKEKK